ncbi:MAG: DUF2851 family protein [Bacteroidetes bacterium]|nr:DUF2851 family protein [Bacteroidota bacterium]
MNEHYLHFIWQKKRLPFHQIKTTKDESVDILYVGDYNALESGPDFSMAKVRIDGLVWVGSIEFHVKSSDWYKHKHHLDKAYNNVILHVVHTHDRDVTVEGRILPVIELKQHVDSTHYLQFSKLNLNDNSDFPCKKMLQENIDELEKMKNQAIQNRLFVKTNEKHINTQIIDQAIFLRHAANAFGTSVNQQPFEQLINSYSLDELKQFDATNKRAVLSQFLWKRKGVISEPNKRLNQFINFINTFDFEFHFWELPASMIFMHFEQQFKKAQIKSPFLLNNFLINCVAPFVFWKGNNGDDPQLIKKAIQILTIIPKETNYITRKWKEIGVHPKNAYDSQALLEIYKQFCTRKECLNCMVGKKITGT